MIRVSLENILDLGLPVNTTKEVGKIGNSKKVLKGLERKYKLQSHKLFRKANGKYGMRIYEIDKEQYSDIPEIEKRWWLKNYKEYVSASMIYKMVIIFNKIF